ncbi:MAG: glycoside hydrolase family 15 protein [Candidatus Nanopelagicales bacterium]|nr:glycoside hydrolase family 15 protein [Candidatus Nanopelagicales bacterium]MDZ4248770.1 glycoside hydrolase family 15 protein [Candidatus Nanopelagicales bacterium]
MSTRCWIVGAAVIAVGAASLAACSSSPPSEPPEAGAMSYYGVGRKDCVGTARNDTSKVWFTVAGGALSDVYQPTIDITNMQSMQFIVTDGETFTDLQLRDMTYKASTDSTGLACTVTSTAKSGKYELVTTYVTDPRANTVLVRTRLTALQGPASDLKLYVRVDPSINGNGGGGDPATGGNSGADSATIDADSGSMLSWDLNTKTAAANATYIQPTYLAVKANKPFTQAGSGFAGTGTDGLTQLDKDRKLTTVAPNADNGNVTQTAELDTSGGEVVLALGFGQTAQDATGAASSSLGRGFTKAMGDYRLGWKRYDASLKKPAASLRGVPASAMPSIAARYWKAANVVRASQDKTFSGAVSAGLAAPWGNTYMAGQGQPENQGINVAGSTGGSPPYFGSYREMFSRDMAEAAGSMLVAGDVDFGRAVARFILEKQQLPTGEIPRNSLPNGEKAPDTNGTQLDESAYPILLAYQSGLGTDAVLYREHIRKTADFIVSRGPSFGVERWEEQTGYSPSTIAAQIAGLVSAARIAALNGDGERSQLYLAVADHFQRSVKKWTVTTSGPDKPGRYFIRVSKDGNPNSSISYSLNNGSGTYDQRAVIDQGFLELTRLGVLPADDPDIVASLGVVDRSILNKTPSGVGFNRYGTSEPGSEDGYGDCYIPGPTDCRILGKPFPGGTGEEMNTGTGQVWPLLSGERAEHAIALGKSEQAGDLIRAMHGFASDAGLLPEQAWVYAPLAASPYGSDPSTASIGFVPGKPGGSATPLTWAEAQFVRLTLDLSANEVLEQPDIVRNRYVAKKPPRAVELRLTSPASGSVPPGAETAVTGRTVPGAQVSVATTNLTTGDTSVASTRADSKGEFLVRLAVTSGSSLTAASTSRQGTGYAQILIGPVPSAS